MALSTSLSIPRCSYVIYWQAVGPSYGVSESQGSPLGNSSVVFLPLDSRQFITVTPSARPCCFNPQASCEIGGKAAPFVENEMSPVFLGHRGPS